MFSLINFINTQHRHHRRRQIHQRSMIRTMQMLKRMLLQAMRRQQSTQQYRHSNQPLCCAQVAEMLSLLQRINSNHGKSSFGTFFVAAFLSPFFKFPLYHRSIQLNFNRKSNLIKNKTFFVFLLFFAISTFDCSFRSFILCFQFVCDSGLHRTSIQLRIVIKRHICSEPLKLQRTLNQHRPASFPPPIYNHCIIRCHRRIYNCCRER